MNKLASNKTYFIDGVEAVFIEGQKKSNYSTHPMWTLRNGNRTTITAYETNEFKNVTLPITPLNDMTSHSKLLQRHICGGIINTGKSQLLLHFSPKSCDHLSHT